MTPEKLRLITSQILGLSPEQCSLIRMDRVLGGGNNQAFKVRHHSQSYFLKLYLQNPGDPRQRGPTEYQWLNVLSGLGVARLPRTFGFIQETDFAVGLYEFIDGHPVRTGEVAEDLVRQAMSFLKEVNGVRNTVQAQTLPWASEACFSYQEHWQTIERRVVGLKNIETGLGPVFEQARCFVDEKLMPAWTELSKNKPADFNRVLPLDFRMLSPSDFGFHNALRTDSLGLRFIDFEYAGWDDPAKLICDFFNQVAVPVPMNFYPEVLRSVEDIAGVSLAERAEKLMPMYTVKWCCILLNHFLPLGARRKKFALQNQPEWETLLAKQLHLQLSNAAAKLESIHK
jgi:hypothetical protein